MERQFYEAINLTDFTNLILETVAVRKGFKKDHYINVDPKLKNNLNTLAYMDPL